MGMAGGGSTDDYRLPAYSGPERSSDIESLMHAMTASRHVGPFDVTPRYSMHGAPDADVSFDRNIGRAHLHGQHVVRGNRSDYGVDMPLGRGHFSVGAGASHGFVPDSVRAGYSMRFAEGGMVPPYASGGGLSDLPVPDTMFDEPDTGGYGDGYANGGLVAFADGGDVDPLGWMHGTTVRGGQWGAPRGYGPHSGLDLAYPAGRPVGVVAPGVVISTGHDHQSGNYVIVKHPDGHTSSYTELASIAVERSFMPGQFIFQDKRYAYQRPDLFITDIRITTVGLIQISIMKYKSLFIIDNMVHCSQ